MSTGYLAEVDTPNGTVYVGHGGVLKKLPQFFTDPKALRDVLVQDHSSNRFSYTLDRFKTTVIVVEKLEAGMRASSAKTMTLFQFESLPILNVRVKPRTSPNAVFKLQLLNTKSEAPKFAGPGKYGKTWEKTGHLRSHLRLDLGRLVKDYAGAEVVEIIIGEDGCTSTRVSKTPVLDFYKNGSKDAQLELSKYLLEIEEQDDIDVESAAFVVSQRILDIGNRPL